MEANYLSKAQVLERGTLWFSESERRLILRPKISSIFLSHETLDRAPGPGRGCDTELRPLVIGVVRPGRGPGGQLPVERPSLHPTWVSSLFQFPVA
jgi:hypothetical protein